MMCSGSRLVTLISVELDMDDQIKSFQICPRDTWAIGHGPRVGGYWGTGIPAITQVHAIGLIEGHLIPYVIFGGELQPITYEFDFFHLIYGERPTQADLVAFLDLIA